MYFLNFILFAQDFDNAEKKFFPFVSTQQIVHRKTISLKNNNNKIL